jgi:hypothetical protein
MSVVTALAVPARENGLYGFELTSSAESRSKYLSVKGQPVKESREAWLRLGIGTSTCNHISMPASLLIKRVKRSINAYKGPSDVVAAIGHWRAGVFQRS